jgi:hypothetical protein
MDSERDSRADAELLRTSARDPEAFGAFYDRRATPLLAYFQRYAGRAPQPREQPLDRPPPASP